MINLPAGGALDNLHRQRVWRPQSCPASDKAGTGRLGKDAFYARFVEFGTVHAPAQPFIGPGFDASKEQAAQAIARRLKQRLDKAGA